MVLDHLKDPEQWTRTHAKRALVERGNAKEVADALAEWVAAINWRLNNGTNTGTGIWTPATASAGDLLFQVYRKVSF